MTPTVIGLDISLTGTGLSDGHATWLIRTSGKKADTLTQRSRRLGGIRGAVLIACDDADLIVIEQPAFASSSGHAHDRSGLWWLIVADLLDRGHTIAEVPPTVLKKYATGRGNANKGAMIDATARRFPDVDTGGGDDNRCDAVWLAAMGQDYLGIGSHVPAAHRAALGAVAWPSEGAAA